jgi:hypothetical protein
MGACGGTGYKATIVMVASNNKMRPQLFLVFVIFMLAFSFYFVSLGSQKFSAIVLFSFFGGLDVFFPFAYRKDNTDFLSTSLKRDKCLVSI